MKKDKKTRNIPIILISATATSVAQRAKDCGAEGYLGKPFEPDEFIGEVTRVLRSKRRTIRSKDKFSKNER